MDRAINNSRQSTRCFSSLEGRSVIWLSFELKYQQPFAKSQTLPLLPTALSLASCCDSFDKLLLQDQINYIVSFIFHLDVFWHYNLRGIVHPTTVFRVWFCISFLCAQFHLSLVLWLPPFPKWVNTRIELNISQSLRTIDVSLRGCQILTLPRSMDFLLEHSCLGGVCKLLIDSLSRLLQEVCFTHPAQEWNLVESVIV